MKHRIFISSVQSEFVEARQELHDNILANALYEIPPAMVTEAIVNTVVHGDHTRNASIQVMVFRDRVEVWNPGRLPMRWTVEKLKKVHNSVPPNLLLAQPIYLKGYIERLGTGTSDMVKLARENDLKEPLFAQDDQFKVCSTDQVPTKHPASTQHAEKESSIPIEVRNLLKVLEGEMSRKELQELLNLKDKRNFRENYLEPASQAELIKMKFPNSPNHPRQRYVLTDVGIQLKTTLND